MIQNDYPVSKVEIQKRSFKAFDVCDYPDKENISYQLQAKDISRLPECSDEQLIQLRKKLDYLFHAKHQGRYDLLYENCNLNETTFRKFIRGTRRLSKTNLTKFIIGTGLDQVTAEELYSLNETPFDYENRFDYIVACAINDGDGLDDLHEELVRFGCKGLLTEDNE